MSQAYPKPFVRLASPRAVKRTGLPPDLAEFYTEYEGVGLESSDPDWVVRMCKLQEVARVGWADLYYGLADPIPEGWEKFTALRIGMGIFFEEIVYVLDAPSCPPGSILAVGSSVIGPGGDGTGEVESSLVLAANFPSWLAHLERWGWSEPAITSAWNLTERER